MNKERTTMSKEDNSIPYKVTLLNNWNVYKILSD